MLYHTSNLTYAQTALGMEEEVKHGDMVYWRIEDQVGELVPRDLGTLHEVSPPSLALSHSPRPTPTRPDPNHPRKISQR